MPLLWPLRLENFSWKFSPFVRIPLSTFFAEDLTIFLPTVKHVPEWFPGAGFKRFAKVAKESIDNFVNLPFQHVKQSFEVREPPLSLPVRVSYQDELQAGTLTTPSIMATCLEELTELRKEGVDEEVIRGVSATVCFGEHHHHCITVGRKITFETTVMLGGEETVSDIQATTSPH